MEITKYIIKKKGFDYYLRKSSYNVYNCETNKYEKHEGGYTDVDRAKATIFDDKDYANKICCLYSGKFAKYEVKPVKVII